MSQSDTEQDSNSGAAAEAAKLAEQKRQPTVSEPGGFKNDPDDPTNPNEEIERARRQVRP